MPGPDFSQISQYLDERFVLDALWVFGSEAAGTANVESDIDLAALFRRRPSPAEILDARHELAARLTRDVVLVDLDQASPILVMQVLRKGRLLVDSQPAHRVRLMASAPGRYEDLKIMRRDAERALVQRARRRTLT